MSEAVHTMFSDIAPKYDRANAVLSMGVHRRWRRRTVELCAVRAGQHILDCATGTGDLALEMKRAVGATGTVIATDFNADMLAFAPRKAERSRLDVTFAVADAMDIPYEDDRFDVTSIAFGIRNVDDPVQALREMVRVTRPGGRIAVLEFGQPRGLFGSFFRWYSKHIIPFIGGLITGHREAYDYLPRTSAAFPCADDFVSLMKEAGGLESIQWESLTGGIAFLYVGVKA
jgi:demethylmenaquinone methyltransferase / 2-methoxy-6-polyprenyl-1,4-benzoquinol methylase